jgi:hypothetical protein
MGPPSMLYWKAFWESLILMATLVPSKVAFRPIAPQAPTGLPGSVKSHLPKYWIPGGGGPPSTVPLLEAPDELAEPEEEPLDVEPPPDEPPLPEALPPLLEDAPLDVEAPLVEPVDPEEEPPLEEFPLEDPEPDPPVPPSSPVPVPLESELEQKVRSEIETAATNDLASVLPSAVPSGWAGMSEWGALESTVTSANSSTVVRTERVIASRATGFTTP